MDLRSFLFLFSVTICPFSMGQIVTENNSSIESKQQERILSVNDFMVASFVNTDEVHHTISPVGTNKQSNLKRLREKNASIYIMSEIPDSITSFPFEKEFRKQFNKNKYWIVTDRIENADMILCFRGYVVNDGTSMILQSYSVVFDNQFNFLLRTKSRNLLAGYRNINENTYLKRFCRDITQDIKSAKNRKRLVGTKIVNYSGKFDLYYLSGMQAIREHRYKDAKENLIKCIELDSEQWQLYKTIGYCCAEIEEYKSAIKYFDSYLDNDPTDASLDYVYGIYKGLKIQKSIERSMKIAQICGIVSVAVSGAVNVYAATQGISTNNLQQVTVNSMNLQNSNNIKHSSKVEKQTCTLCKGSGKNPAPTSSPSFAGTGQKYCEDCHKYVSMGHGYHGTCPSCSGKGYIMKIKY